jgi:hypothetical protein
VTGASGQVRLLLLLAHLRPSRWRKTPANVGLKTGLIAEQMGLVVSRGEIRTRTYRLTAAGIAFLADNTAI